MVHLGRVSEDWRRWTGGIVRFAGPFFTLASPFSIGGAMIRREKRVLLRHYLEQGVPKAAIARHVGVSRETIYRWIATGQLDRDLDDEALRYRPRAPASSKLDRLQGDHRHPTGGLSEAERRTAVQRGAGGGLSGRLRPSEALRAQGPATGACGAGPEVRDPTGPPGPGGLRGLPAAVGQAARADRGAGLLAADVAQVL